MTRNANPPSESDAILQTRIRQQEVVADLGQRALESDGLDRLLRDAAAAIAETLDSDYCKVLELLPGSDELILRRGVGWQEGVVGTATVPTDAGSQAGYTLITEKPVIVDDIRTESRFSGPNLLLDHDVVSGISVVIGSVDDPWGVLGAHTTERREFTEHDANFVQSVASVLAAAIDRTAKEQQLREREARLERYKAYTDDILAAVDDMIYVVDESGTFLRWNESLNEVTGYSEAEVATMHPLEFVAEEERDALANGIAEIFETGSARIETTVLTKDGERVPYEFVASRLETPDGETALAGIGRDMTERREQERALKESERRYRTIAESFPNGIVTLFDDDLTYVLAAGQAFDELSVSPDEVEGRTPREAWGDDAADDLEPALWTALEGEQVAVELAYGGRDWVVHAVPIADDDDGSVSAGVTMAQNITERKEREQFLHDAKAQLEAATEAGAIGTWEWRIPEDRMIVGTSFARTFGVDPDEAREGVSLERFIDSIHEDDRDRVTRKIEEAIETCGEYEAEYCVRNADGEFRWVYARGHVECDENGDPLTFPGALTDVTERREAEEALRESEERYRTLFESIDEGFCIVEMLFDDDEDPVDYRFLEANPAFETQTGLADVEGKTTAEVGMNLERYWYEIYGRVALTGESTRFERYVEGWDQWFDVFAFRIGDPQERQVAILFDDITERKRSKEALERLNGASQELMEADAEEIDDRTPELVGSVLGVEYAALWRYDETTGELRERSDHVGSEARPDAIRHPDGFPDRVWRTFVSDDVVVGDEGKLWDDRPPDSGLRSHLLVSLGRHGVLCAGSTRREAFDERTVDLAEAVAATIEAAWNRAAGERQLAERNDELERLDRLNSLIREIDTVLVEADSLEAIDRAVCERLADSAYYEFAWIGERNPVTETIEPREWAGVDSGYVENLEITTDETVDRDPVATAVRTRELQVVADIAINPRAAAWREATLERGARSCIAIPMVYNESLYGVLTVYTDHPQPDERDHAVLAELGETIAHAIDAVETKRTLLSDSVELTLEAQEPDDVLVELADETECEVEFDGLVRQRDGLDRLFFVTRDVAVEDVIAGANQLPGIEEVATIRNDGTGCDFEATLTESTLASHLLDNRALIRSLTATGDSVTASVDLPTADSVREFVEAVRDEYPTTGLVTRRTRDRSIRTRQDLRDALPEQLTDRQREILEMAYLSGFFESPRVRTGKELSEALGITQSTFSHHLRNAERRLCEMVFENY